MKRLPVVAFLFIVGFSCLPVAAQERASDSRPSPDQTRDIWNRVFSRAKDRGVQWEANAFLADFISELKPGSALDIGMGQGRNTLLLAQEGWKVTGFDLSDEAVAQARAAAGEAGLEIQAETGDVNTYEYGEERYDLVVAMYMHGLILPHAAKIVDSLKPGGTLLIEGFHRDLNRESVQGGYFGYHTNQLLEEFGTLRVLYYEDLQGQADWGQSMPGKKPIVRLAARKVP